MSLVLPLPTKSHHIIMLERVESRDITRDMQTAQELLTSHSPLEHNMLLLSVVRKTIVITWPCHLNHWFERMTLISVAATNGVTTWFMTKWIRTGRPSMEIVVSVLHVVVVMIRNGGILGGRIRLYRDSLNHFCVGHWRCLACQYQGIILLWTTMWQLSPHRLKLS